MAYVDPHVLLKDVGKRIKEALGISYVRLAKSNSLGFIGSFEYKGRAYVVQFKTEHDRKIPQELFEKRALALMPDGERPDLWLSRCLPYDILVRQAGLYKSAVGSESSSDDLRLYADKLIT